MNSSYKSLSLSVLLYLIAALMLAFMVGSILSWRAEKELTQWTQDQSIPAKQDLLVVKQWLDIADRLQMMNSDVKEQLGRISEWQALDNFGKEQEHENALLKARDYYKASLQSRPGWPYDWSNLAYINHQLDQFKKRDKALQRAMRYGPFEPRVLQRIIMLNLQTWPKMKNNNSMVNAVQNGLQSFPDMTLSMVGRVGLLSEFCAYYAKTELAKKNCQIRLNKD
ncbi:MAG: tetratricopeptide repeat protein [bacterium]